MLFESKLVLFILGCFASTRQIYEHYRKCDLMSQYLNGLSQAMFENNNKNYPSEHNFQPYMRKMKIVT